MQDPSSSFEDSDLDIETSDQKNRKFTKVTHKPTKIYGIDVGIDNERERLINARDKAFVLVDKHLRDWRKTSIEFRKQFGIG